MVISELTKSYTKDKRYVSVADVGVHKSIPALVAAFLFTFVIPVRAAVLITPDGVIPDAEKIIKGANQTGFMLTTYNDEKEYPLASGWGSIAIGRWAKATGTDAVAIGTSAKAGMTGWAIGDTAKASGIGSIAFGHSTNASGLASVAMGRGSEASNKYAITVGAFSKASGERSTAMGYETEASGYGATSMGQRTQASGNWATAMGYETLASGQGTLATGGRTKASGNSATAMGYSTEASGDGSTSMGGRTYASGKYSTAMGYRSQAMAENSLAASGGIVETFAENSIALGNKAKVDVPDGAALGSGALANRFSGEKGYLANGDTSETFVSTANAIAVGGGQTHWGGIVTRQVTGVAAGSEDTDAVNVAQLKKVASATANINTKVNHLGNRITQLDNRMDRVGAGAAALAALHPQDFDPDDKWDFAVGYGNYKDAHAAAIGAFYRPNEDVLFSLGGSIGGGENLVNAGITFKLGQKNTVSRSRTAMGREILELKTLVAKQDREIQLLKQAVGLGKEMPIAAKDVSFPDVPKDHWAYQYVKNLADRGYLEGYPDDEFKGDRAMTRYEYAAIVYRALQNGAPVDADMGRSLGEFGPEIEKVASTDRFRVDRISGKDNDRYKVERVRVNDKDDKTNKKFRDVYGSYIQK